MMAWLLWVDVQAEALTEALSFEMPTKNPP